MWDSPVLLPEHQIIIQLTAERNSRRKQQWCWCSMFNPQFQYDWLFTALLIEILSVQLKWALKCPWGQLVSTAWQRVEQQTAPSDAADLTSVSHLRWCLFRALSELSKGSRYKRLEGTPADRVTWHLLCDSVTAMISLICLQNTADWWLVVITRINLHWEEQIVLCPLKTIFFY